MSLFFPFVLHVDTLPATTKGFLATIFGEKQRRMMRIDKRKELIHTHTYKSFAENEFFECSNVTLHEKSSEASQIGFSMQETQRNPTR